jgi:RNA polymerase sigma factor (sigma-70 family)
MSALARIYDLHVGALYNFGNKICQDATLVEDAIHDLFADLWKYRETLAPANSVRAYLYASLRRKIVKEHAKNASKLRYDHRWEELNLTVHSVETTRIEKEVSEEQLKKLKAHLNNLSPRQYEAIILKFYDDLSYADIAVIMEMNEQSVRNLIQRGLEHLRQYSKLVISALLLATFLLYFN